VLLLDVVLVEADTDVLRIDLDQFREWVLQASAEPMLMVPRVYGSSSGNSSFAVGLVE
jgi:hypothetical protein